MHTHTHRTHVRFSLSGMLSKWEIAKWMLDIEWTKGDRLPFEPKRNKWASVQCRALGDRQRKISIKEIDGEWVNGYYAVCWLLCARCTNALIACHIPSLQAHPLLLMSRLHVLKYAFADLLPSICNTPKKNSREIPRENTAAHTTNGCNVIHKKEDKSTEQIPISIERD